MDDFNNRIHDFEIWGSIKYWGGSHHFFLNEQI